VKCVEVRTWPTNRVGPVLIHASRVPDPRPDGWAWLTNPDLKAAAELLGGVVGAGELIGCVRYPTLKAFAADRGRHLNPPGWFRPPRLCGLAFRGLRPVDFWPCPGNTFFFPVEGYPL
jgi:hypothetical protein